MRPKLAKRRIQSFQQRFGKPHLILACHAAFPLGLTPDLLYQLWANFQRDIRGQQLNIPWVAVADLLLSNLCQEVGYELYEMDQTIRNALLSHLQKSKSFGQSRIDQLSDFLLDYIRKQLQSDDPDVRDFAQVQKWTALVYTRPSEAAREIALTLTRLDCQNLEDQNVSEFVRMASIVETFAEPLGSEFKPLLIYLRGMVSLIRGNVDRGMSQLEEIQGQRNQVKIAGVPLLIPQQTTQELQLTFKSQKTNLHQFNKKRFFKWSNPAKTLNVCTKEDRQYYIDFSEVRGGKLIEQIARKITRLSPDSPTCQLFTGHIGSGKSTELLRLKAELEEQEFHVVYFESSKDLDMADVDITDILLAIAREVSESIEQLDIQLQLTRFKAVLEGLANVLQAAENNVKTAVSSGLESGNINTDEKFYLSLGIGKITAKARDDRELRILFRQYLEPRTSAILQVINHELLEPSIQQLKQRKKKGLVVIVDNLDRIINSINASGRTQPEYLFIDRGDQLNQLSCHVVYTIPLGLIFSDAFRMLTNQFGSDPKTLPMVPVRFPDETPCEEGIELLRQMVMARAFPEVKPDEYSSLIPQVFEQSPTLDRLCIMSGGHIRTLLVLLYGCLQKEDPPISREVLEDVIQKRRDQMLLSIESKEWEMLHQVYKIKKLTGLTDYQTLLRSLWVFEYRYRQDFWFDVNPILVEAPEFSESRRV